MNFPITDGRPCIRSRGSTRSQAENDLSDRVAAAELAIIRDSWKGKLEALLRAAV